MVLPGQTSADALSRAQVYKLKTPTAAAWGEKLLWIPQRLLKGLNKQVINKAQTSHHSLGVFKTPRHSL